MPESGGFRPSAAWVGLQPDVVAGLAGAGGAAPPPLPGRLLPAVLRAGRGRRRGRQDRMKAGKVGDRVGEGPERGNQRPDLGECWQRALDRREGRGHNIADDGVEEPGRGGRDRRQRLRDGIGDRRRAPVRCSTVGTIELTGEDRTDDVKRVVEICGGGKRPDHRKRRGRLLRQRRERENLGRFGRGRRRTSDWRARFDCPSSRGGDVVNRGGRLGRGDRGGNPGAFRPLAGRAWRRVGWGWRPVSGPEQQR